MKKYSLHFIMNTILATALLIPCIFSDDETEEEQSYTLVEAYTELNNETNDELNESTLSRFKQEFITKVFKKYLPLAIIARLQNPKETPSPLSKKDLKDLISVVMTDATAFVDYVIERIRNTERPLNDVLDIVCPATTIDTILAAFDLNISSIAEEAGKNPTIAALFTTLQTTDRPALAAAWASYDSHLSQIEKELTALNKKAAAEEEALKKLEKEQDAAFDIFEKEQTEQLKEKIAQQLPPEEVEKIIETQDEQFERFETTQEEQLEKFEHEREEAYEKHREEILKKQHPAPVELASFVDNAATIFSAFFDTLLQKVTTANPALKELLAEPVEEAEEVEEEVEQVAQETEQATEEPAQPGEAIQLEDTAETPAAPLATDQANEEEEEEEEEESEAEYAEEEVPIA